MIPTKIEIEKKIAKYVGRKYCILVGRATTAIYLALKAFNFDSGNVITPSIVCPNPIFSILYSDLTPKFCDINLSDYTIDIDSFANSIDDTTRAVIPINLYGYPANYDKLIPICRKRNIKIIEDAAQSFGGNYKKKKLGRFGEISVLSFGHTKIIDIDSGGALLTDDNDLFTKVKLEYEQLMKEPNDLKEKSEFYRKIYYSLQPFWQKNDDFYYLFSSFPKIFKSLFLFKFQKENLPSLNKELEGLDKEVEIRKNNTEEYINILKNHPKIRLPTYDLENGAIWRFSFLIEGDNQLSISERLREKRFDVSNWYPSTHKMFLPPSQFNPSDFKNSNYFEKHILNFWVYSGTSKEDIENISYELLNLLNKMD